MTSRREFVSAVLAAAGAAGLEASPLGLPIGCQVYPVRADLGKDFEGTLKKLAGIGYKVIEMCSPPAYKGDFTPLIGVSAADLKKRIEDCGLKCISCHYPLRELRESADDRITYAQGLGMKQMVISSFGLPKTATLSDWTKAAEEANKIGEKTAKAGIQLGFHNHNGEFEKLDGVLIYDQLLKTFDPKLVKGQFQVTVISMGFDTAEILAKNPGRFVSMHLSDYSLKDKKGVAVGKGDIDWKKTFAAAKKAGVKNIFVEMDWDAMRDSYPFLAAFKG